MIATDIRFHPLSKKITLFVGSILLINIIAAHKCYVCGPKNADTNSENFNNIIPTCDGFNPNIPFFVRECRPQSRGCSIQTNGSVITRACEHLAVVDCKKANNVEYCYCNTDMCNKFHPSPILQDDEDDFEGSGTEHERNFITKIPNVIETNKSTPVSSRADTKHELSINTLLSICTLLFLLFCDTYFIL